VVDLDIFISDLNIEKSDPGIIHCHPWFLVEITKVIEYLNLTIGI
jgi:hypothetical protein